MSENFPVMCDYCLFRFDPIGGFCRLNVPSEENAEFPANVLLAAAPPPNPNESELEGC